MVTSDYRGEEKQKKSGEKAEKQILIFCGIFSTENCLGVQRDPPYECFSEKNPYFFRH